MDKTKTLKGVYKFVKWDVDPLENLSESPIYKLYEKLVIREEKPTREEKDYLFSRLYENSYFNQSIPLLGWVFPFHTILKKYVVKFNYDRGNYTQIYAPDKMSIRNNIYINGIVEIIEIPKH